jgi:hypothetical protein
MSLHHFRKPRGALGSKLLGKHMTQQDGIQDCEMEQVGELGHEFAKREIELMARKKAA